jgi:hypothetical protein
METIKIEVKGILTRGGYNDMENGYPVFLDGDSLSDVVKDQLWKLGQPTDFTHATIGSDGPQVPNHLVGRRAVLTLEILPVELEELEEDATQEKQEKDSPSRQQPQNGD